MVECFLERWPSAQPIAVSAYSDSGPAAAIASVLHTLLLLCLIFIVVDFHFKV